jgi:dipeptidyl aminopeptidase/acylaminoacyl peptidase
LAQFYANRGYAVLQPNFRGSTGYGDAWFQNNGFRSWRLAVGDVADAGRWLVSEGIADPSKLAIVGWSYGGYTALQANVIAPDLFKAAVAIAPVTDFKSTIDESRGWSNWLIERERVGSGPHIREGSPAQNAAAIKAPVLLFHGDMDLNVDIRQSRLMADRLRDAGKKQELIVYRGLSHSLADSAARADMLRRSDQFLRASMGM